MDSSDDFLDSVSCAVIQPEDCIIAYIDVLGTKSVLSSDDESKVTEFVNHLRTLYGYIVKTDANKRIFSDNIVIFDSYSEENLRKIVDIVSSTQYYLLMRYKLASRGGIARGILYYNEDFILGKGLVDAYLLESEKALSPRVIIDPDLVIDSNLVCKSLSDDFYMINYIEHSCDEDSDTPDYDIVRKHKLVLEELIETNRHNTDDEERVKI
jgi:hypothetical protein